MEMKPASLSKTESQKQKVYTEQTLTENTPCHQLSEFYQHAEFSPKKKIFRKRRVIRSGLIIPKPTAGCKDQLPLANPPVGLTSTRLGARESQVKIDLLS